MRQKGIRDKRRQKETANRDKKEVKEMKRRQKETGNGDKKG